MDFNNSSRKLGRHMRMNHHRHTSRQDRPIESDVTDELGRAPFVDSLVRALIVDELDGRGEVVRRHATGYVVGLTGRWGLGKSSVLNLLRQRLGSMDRVIVAYFNPWLFKGPDELIVGFFNALRVAMGQSRAEEARALVDLLDRYWGTINLAGNSVAGLVDLYGASGVATAKWNIWAPRLRKALCKSKQRTPEEERIALELKIAETKFAIVVLIDELDRIEDDEVRAVAQLVKAVGDIKGISYLVAYDPDRVIQALGRGEGEERRRSGEFYLEKIIQHPIPLRPLFEEDSKALIEVALADHEINLEAPRGNRQHAILDHLIHAIETPREVKRLVGAFSVLERAVRGEICSYDVLAYCWLLTKSPAVRDKIAAHIDDLVSDPSNSLLIKRTMREMNKETETDFVEILGKAAETQKRTLELLFSPFNGDSETGDGERISRRRNLVRMLYLGNPPGMMRRTDLEKLWNDPNLDKLEKNLRNLMHENKLQATIDRLDDIVPLLPEGGDLTFWVALSNIFYRNSDWLTGPETSRALAEDAAMTLYRFGQRDRHQLPRLKNAIEALVTNRDLVLVPSILRRNLFAHGLTMHRQAPRGDEVLSLEETQDLLRRELPRYRAAILDGTALRRLPNTEVIYVVLNSGTWDEEVRCALSGQLTHRDAILTFAALITPPGFSVDSDWINRLVDIASLHEKIEILFKHNEENIIPWLAKSFQQLKEAITAYDAQSKSRIPM